jgi:hypothetical protein
MCSDETCALSSIIVLVVCYTIYDKTHFSREIETTLNHHRLGPWYMIRATAFATDHMCAPLLDHPSTPLRVNFAVAQP